MSILSPTLPLAEEVFYPSSDGKPMAETTIHVRTIMLLLEALQDWFRGRADVFLAADLFWYWEEGNPKAVCAPDVMVVPGVPATDRRSFFTWKENGAIPAVVFEIASQGTWQEDLYDKFSLYERLGVREYFIFDPEALYLRPPLQGFRLEEAKYRRIVSGADGSLLSPELGLYLRPEETMLRLIDSKNGNAILTREEEVEQAKQRIKDLEAELARLRTLTQQNVSPSGPV
jgi:Uma2 family endonuclease